MNRRYLGLIGIMAFIYFAYSTATAARPIPQIGGGNISIHGDENKLEILKQLNAGICRVPISPNDYWNDGSATPSKIDAVILTAHRHGITPMVLFEYYSKWHGPLGDYEKWREIGQAFAERFQPNSRWLSSQGIRDWGITVFSAINEPMWKDNNPEPIPVEDYVDAISGLADGAHSVNPKLNVSPGGFQEIPLFQNRNPYLNAIAHLYNEGKLAALDIHRYWDVEYVPMQGTHDWSLQRQFDQVKKDAGITADIGFYTTEMNFKKRLLTEDKAARGFLTALWDALTVTGNHGRAVTRFVMPWNIFHTESADEHYGLCKTQRPWTPNARGRVLQMVCKLTRGTKIISTAPKTTGITVLTSANRKVWIWQNRPGWSSIHGTSFEIEHLPENAETVDVYTWDGLKRSVDIAGREQVAIEGLTPAQTYMFAAGTGVGEPTTESSNHQHE